MIYLRQFILAREGTIGSSIPGRAHEGAMSLRGTGSISEIFGSLERMGQENPLGGQQTVMLNLNLICRHIHTLDVAPGERWMTNGTGSKRFFESSNSL